MSPEDLKKVRIDVESTPPKTRDQALNDKDKYYHDGSVCPDCGQRSAKETSSNTCVECIRIATSEVPKWSRRHKTPRQVAEENNRSKYFTGRACKHGHMSERYTSSGSCVECHRQKMSARNMVMRETRFLPEGTVMVTVRVPAKHKEDIESIAKAYCEGV